MVPDCRSPLPCRARSLTLSLCSMCGDAASSFGVGVSAGASNASTRSWKDSGVGRLSTVNVVSVILAEETNLMTGVSARVGRRRTLGPLPLIVALARASRLRISSRTSRLIRASAVAGIAGRQGLATITSAVAVIARARASSRNRTRNGTGLSAAVASGRARRFVFTSISGVSSSAVTTAPRLPVPGNRSRVIVTIISGRARCQRRAGSA
jgi:hypothetical protein